MLALTQYDLYLSDGTTFSGRSGGNGSLSITGSATALLTYGNETLDHVAVSLGSAASAGARRWGPAPLTRSRSEPGPP